MRRRTLGQQLRAIVLATPFLGGVACGTGTQGIGDGAPCPDVTLDAGGAFGCWSLVAFPLPPDGGNCQSCVDACANVERPYSSSTLCACHLDPGQVSCAWFLANGRRPAGLAVEGSLPVGSLLASYFAHSAHLEAASVPAFRTLARELAAHRAPQRLVVAARRAQADEVRHTRTVSALARRFDAVPLRPVVARSTGARGLEAIATENAIEGCLRETYGALSALWQGAHAADRKVARAMTAIAVDETRHAELAWQVARWAEPKLDGAARRRVAGARARALTELTRDLARPVSPSLVALAGLPTAATAQALLRGLAPSLEVA